MSDFDDLGFQEHGKGDGFEDLGFTPHESPDQSGEAYMDLDSWIRTGKAFSKALPAAGAMFGGAAGTIMGVPSGPGAIATGVAGAGLGMAAGESLKNIAEKYLFDEDKTRSDIYGGPAKAALDGATYEMGGQALSAIPGLIKGGVNSAKNLVAKKLGPNLDYTPIANKEAVEGAAKELGLNVPRGVLTDNPTYQKLESGLSQSGSLPAKGIRDQYADFFKGIDNASSKISDLKTPDSDFSIGSNIQKDLADQVNASREPVSKMYEDLVPHMQKIPVDRGVVNKAFGALKRNPLFLTKDGQEMLQEYKAIALEQPELASLKEWRSTLGDSLGAGASPLEAKRIDALRNAVTSIRDNSIEALKADMPKGMHGEVDDLISQITLADQAHASNLTDINSVKGILGNKDFKSPVTFLNKLGESREGDLAQKASNLDITSLRNMQQKFPSIFEKAKAAKINDMVQSSTNPASGFNEVRFVKQYDGMDKELKDLIFSPEMQSHIESLKTVRQAIPPKLGPSGTPEGQMMMDMFNPKRNALDYGIKKTLDGAVNPAVSIPETSSAVPVNKVSPLLQLLPGGAEKAAPQMNFPRAAEKQNQDGASNFNNSQGKEAILQKTQGSKYGQVLQNAAKNGDQSLAAAHYVLANRDADYRKLTEDGQ